MSKYPYLAVPFLLASGLKSMTPFGLLQTQLSEFPSTCGHNCLALTIKRWWTLSRTTVITKLTAGIAHAHTEAKEIVKVNFYELAQLPACMLVYTCKDVTCEEEYMKCL